MFSKVLQNRVIRTMVMVEFFGAIGFGVFSPVFAVFVAGTLEGGSVKVVGFASAVLLLVKGLSQLPIARFLDKTDGERDDFWAYFIGQILFALAVFLYLVASIPTHIYLIQALMGFALALNVPALYGVFTRHLDKHYESFEWSVYSVISYSFATAGAGAAGGIIADVFGFKTLFTVSGLFFLFSALLSLLFLRRYVSKQSIRPRPAGIAVGPHRDHQGR